MIITRLDCSTSADLNILVTDYGEENPLFYDYYGFQPELYRLKFKSRGDSSVSQRVVDLFKEVSQDISYQNSHI